MSKSIFFPLYSEPTHYSDTSLFGQYGNFEKSTNKTAQEKDLSIFTQHELKPNSSTYHSRPINNNDFFFSFLIIDLIVIIILLALYKKQLLNTLLALFSRKHYQQIEGKSLIKHPVLPSLFGVFLLNISLLVYIIIKQNIVDLKIPNTPYLLVYILVALLLFYFIKILIVYMSALLFDISKQGKTYISYMLLWTINMGVYLSFFLWLFIYAYHWGFIVVFLIFYSLFTSFRILHTSLQIAPKIQFNSFHFFLYLCAVEILPLMVLGKIVISGI